MRFKKIITFLIIILIIYFGAIFIMKKYFFPIKHESYVEKYSEEYNLDKYLVYSVIKVESNFNGKAESNKGAKGLMQIMDFTGEWGAREIGVNYFLPSMLFDEELNIRIGTWYLNNLMQEFDNDVDLVLAAYNGGSGNVNKWLSDEEYSEDGKTLSIIPFNETKKYVDKVNIINKIYKYLYEK